MNVPSVNKKFDSLKYTQFQTVVKFINLLSPSITFFKRKVYSEIVFWSSKRSIQINETSSKYFPILPFNNLLKCILSHLRWNYHVAIRHFVLIYLK